MESESQTFLSDIVGIRASSSNEADKPGRQTSDVYGEGLHYNITGQATFEKIKLKSASEQGAANVANGFVNHLFVRSPWPDVRRVPVGMGEDGRTNGYGKAVVAELRRVFRKKTLLSHILKWFRESEREASTFLNAIVGLRAWLRLLYRPDMSQRDLAFLATCEHDAVMALARLTMKKKESIVRQQAKKALSAEQAKLRLPALWETLSHVYRAAGCGLATKSPGDKVPQKAHSFLRRSAKRSGLPVPRHTEHHSERQHPHRHDR